MTLHRIKQGVRYTAVLICIAMMVSPPAAGQDAYGPWQVRRGRTTDWEKAGGHPTWTVTFSGPQQTPNVAIGGDEAGRARGTILIGRRVRLDAGKPVSLDTSYTTYCRDKDRCGRLDILIIDPQAWDRMSVSPDTEQVFDGSDQSVCLARQLIRSHVGADVLEPIAMDAGRRAALFSMARRLSGREVVLAVAWTGLHGAEERASLTTLRIMEIDPMDSMKLLFDRLDLDRPQLAGVEAALQADDQAGAARELMEHFRQRTEPACPGDLRSRPEHTISSGRLAEADAALQNRFTGQSKYGLQQVPEGIDWSFNPTKDPEWTWQFNRHSAWRALAEAYLASGNEDYAQKWRELLNDWVLENPPGTPWSWRTIEAGIRGQGWPTVYLAFVGSEALGPADHMAFLSSLADHAEYLMPDGHFHSGSNWGQIESLGLLQIGSFFPEFKDAGTWRDTAWRRLEGEMFRQVLEDGAQVELTTSYHQGVRSGFIRAAEIAQLGGAVPTREYWDRLEKMYEYTMFLQKPDGTQPMLGDSWPGNTRGSVSEGGRRFDRPDMAWVGSVGKQGERPTYLDTQLPSAGYYVMRTDWIDAQAIYLLTDVAHRWGGGHQQPDALQLNLFAYGKTLLPDSGSYLYYGPERRRFARTSSHSTVTIDDADQNTSGARLHCFFNSEALSFVDGSHEGYENVTHRRQVLFARPLAGITPYFVVIDRVSGEGAHTADQYWHFLPAPLETNAEHLLARTVLPKGPNLMVKAFATPGIELEEVESWVSFVYTEKEPRPAVRYRYEGELPATFITLLVPYPGETPPALQASAVTLQEPGDALAVQVEGEGFTDVLFARGEPGQVSIEGVNASCRAGMVRTGPDGQPMEVVVVR